MSLHIGDTAGDFTVGTGAISFHDWIGTDRVSFFSHRGVLTPVYATETRRAVQLADGACMSAIASKPGEMRSDWSGKTTAQQTENRAKSVRFA